MRGCTKPFARVRTLFHNGNRTMKPREAAQETHTVPNKLQVQRNPSLSNMNGFRNPEPGPF